MKKQCAILFLIAVIFGVMTSSCSKENTLDKKRLSYEIEVQDLVDYYCNLSDAPAIGSDPTAYDLVNLIYKSQRSCLDISLQLDFIFSENEKKDWTNLLKSSNGYFQSNLANVRNYREQLNKAINSSNHKTEFILAVRKIDKVLSAADDLFKIEK